MFTSILSKIFIVFVAFVVYVILAFFWLSSQESSEAVIQQVQPSVQVTKNVVLHEDDTDTIKPFSLTQRSTVVKDTPIENPSVQTIVEDDGVSVLEVSDVGRTSPYAKTFTWNYGGQSYTTELMLYGSLYGYYFQSPKVFMYRGTPPKNWEEQYFSMFLQTEHADNTIDVLVAQIRDIGRARGLSDDQIVELVVAFVQTIPYDTPKAQRILSAAELTGGTLVYPYETLYQNTGVCSDKSILLYKLLRSLGYGAALFTYDSEQHMSVGVQCPSAYASYASGYCYIETTSIMPIGMIPTLDSTNNRATAPTALRTGDGGIFDAKRALGNVMTYAPTKGVVYTGIVQTQAQVNEVNALVLSMNAQKEKIASKREKLRDAQKDIENIIKKMEDYKNDKKYQEYNALVDEYNDTIEDYEEDIKKFNKRIEVYDDTIAKYNNLVDSITN